MWRELVLRIAPWAEAGEPAVAAVLAQATERLGERFPAQLQTFLLELNGVSDQYGTDVVWTAERILRENAEFRADPGFARLYAPFSALLFFGDNGGGDQFAFGMTGDRPGVVVWDHETDERTRVADSLEQYVTRSLQSGGADWCR